MHVDDERDDAAATTARTTKNVVGDDATQKLRPRKMPVRAS